MEIEETSTLTHLRAYQNISVFKFIITFSVLFIQFFLVFVSLLQFTTLFFFRSLSERAECSREGSRQSCEIRP